MSQSERAAELGAFLRARREELSPEDVGFSTGYRRTNGLRREEVAQLASISSNFYSRIEQGRRSASVSVLDAISKALLLTDSEREYVFSLAGKEDVKPQPRHGLQVHPSVNHFVNELTSAPAIVTGPAMEILSWNRLAAALISDFGSFPSEKRNYVWLMFTEPSFRTLFKDWEQIAQTWVSHLRRRSSLNPSNQSIAQLVADLSRYSEECRSMWEAHNVEKPSRGHKRLHHPIVGDLELDWEALTVSADPDQQIYIWTAQPGSPSADALNILAAWTATEDIESSDLSAR